MAAEIAEQISSIENEIKADMTLKNRDTLHGLDYKITWKIVHSTRFDTNAFKAQHADMYEAFSRATTAKRFVVAKPGRCAGWRCTPAALSRKGR